MLPSLASVDDLSARMAVEAPPARAQARLDDASRWIRSYTRQTFVDDPEAETPVLDIAADQEVVITICCAVAERILANPKGLESQQLGDWQAGYANASVDSYFTAQERDQLDRVANRPQIGVQGTTRRHYDEDERTLWLAASDDPTTPVIPWL